jgi:hypothetical protein
MTRWVGERGYEVEAITLDHRQVLRVSQRVEGRRYLITYAKTVGEVAGLVDLASLVEVVELRR